MDARRKGDEREVRRYSQNAMAARWRQTAG